MLFFYDFWLVFDKTALYGINRRMALIIIAQENMYYDFVLDDNWHQFYLHTNCLQDPILPRLGPDFNQALERKNCSLSLKYYESRSLLLNSVLYVQKVLP